MTNASGRKTDTDLDRQLIQHHHEIVMEQWRQNFQITDAIFRDQQNYVAMVLRGSLLINAGAAVALLAYIGHVVGTTGNGPDVSGAICALLIFTFGVAFSVVATVCLACLQRKYNGAHRKVLGRKKSVINNYMEAVKKVLDGEGAPTPERPLKESHWDSPILRKISKKIFCRIICAAVGSLIIFFVGVVTAACTLSQATAAAKFAAPALEITKTI